MTQNIENWKEGTLNEHPAIEADGHQKSFKNQKIEAEIVVYKQHRGMQMFYDVGLATPSDKDTQEYDIRKVSNQLNSYDAAIEEAKHYMKQNPMVGKKGEILCKDCGSKVSRKINIDSGESNFIMCDPCENYETVEAGTESEHFEVIKSDGKKALKVHD